MHAYFIAPCSTQNPLSVFAEYLHFPIKKNHWLHTVTNETNIYKLWSVCVHTPAVKQYSLHLKKYKNKCIHKDMASNTIIPMLYTRAGYISMHVYTSEQIKYIHHSFKHINICMYNV